MQTLSSVNMRTHVDGLDPLADRQKRSVACHVIQQHDAVRSAKVTSGDGSEPLLPGRIPQLQVEFTLLRSVSVKDSLLLLSMAVVCSKVFDWVVIFEYEHRASLICVLPCMAMFLSSTRMVFTWKSTPSVEARFETKCPFVRRLMKLVLPTAASPANTTLYVRSGGPVGSRSRMLISRTEDAGGWGLRRLGTGGGARFDTTFSSLFITWSSTVICKLISARICL